MASFSLRLESDTAIGEEAKHALRVAAQSVVGQHGVSAYSDTTVDPHITVKVEQDTNPESPRECDNAGVMFCKHRRYTLGDEGAEDPYEEIELFELEGDGTGSYVLDETRLRAVEEMLSIWYDRLLREDESTIDGDRTYDAYNYVSRLCAFDSEHRLRADIAVILPLYLYDHSGITISHGSFSDKWDSGQVGWHYITKKSLEENWNGDVEAAKKCLQAELDEYDNYLRGNVWGYVVENEDGDTIDSCWGFIGDNLEATGMLENVEPQYHELARKAWENRFD